MGNPKLQQLCKLKQHNITLVLGTLWVYWAKGTADQNLIPYAHMPLSFLRGYLPLPIRHRALLTEMPLRVAAPPTSIRISSLNNLEEIVVFVVSLPQCFGCEAMLLGPMWSTVVICHDFRKFVENFLVWYGFAIRSEPGLNVSDTSHSKPGRKKLLTCTGRYRYTSSVVHNMVITTHRLAQ
jgi:hypothetical protein